MMQDGKALQSGTSHNLGQNFATAFDIKFQTRDQKTEHVWTTSWGVSTRLIGGVIMSHSDDEGLVLPPAVAPVVAALVPIYRKDSEKEAVLNYARSILAQLSGPDALKTAEESIGNREILAVNLPGDSRRVVLDMRDTLRPPEKFFHWEQRGTPLRLEIGPRDLEAKKAMVASRPAREKSPVDAATLTRPWLDATLAKMQNDLLERARAFRTARTFRTDFYDDLKKRADEGGFFLMHWDGTNETEAKVKAETKATIRCLPFADVLDTAAGPVNLREPGTDPVSGRPSQGRVIYAQAY
jgi:prolyl-tRNA synthetase